MQDENVRLGEERLHSRKWLPQPLRPGLGNMDNRSTNPSLTSGPPRGVCGVRLRRECRRPLLYYPKGGGSLSTFLYIIFVLYSVCGTSGECGERAPNLSWSTLPFRRFDHGLELSDLSIACFDHAIPRTDHAVSRFDRAVSCTDPMIAPLDLEIPRLDGEHAPAYGVIRQDD